MSFHASATVAIAFSLLIVTSISYGSAISQNNVGYLLTSSNTYIFLGGILYAKAVYVFSNHVNFTSATLSSPNNTTLTFGIGVQGGNVTLTAIGSDGANVSGVAPSSKWSYVYFYYVKDVPAEVDITTGAATVKVTSQQFLASFSSFFNNTLPNVFLNSTGRYVETKQNASPFVLRMLTQATFTGSKSASVTATKSTMTSTLSTSTSTSASTVTLPTTASSSTTTTGISPGPMLTPLVISLAVLAVAIAGGAIGLFLRRRR